MTGASRSSRPSSASWTTAVAVTSLVIENQLQTLRDVIASRRTRSADPNARSMRVPSVSTAITASPGTESPTSPRAAASNPITPVVAAMDRGSWHHH